MIIRLFSQITEFEMETKFIWLLIIQSLATLVVSQDPDFFYFVQQWPGSYYDTKHIRCYPTTGKPGQSFIIRGLWPSFNNGSIPTYCDPISHFNETKVSNIIYYLQTDWPSLVCPSSNGTRLWSEEWEKYGTCSQSVLDQYNYFVLASALKEGLIDIMELLAYNGIQADGKEYSLNSFVNALKSEYGELRVGIECNQDASGNSQFYQIYLCADSSGSVIDCPVLPDYPKCADTVVFPSF